MIILHVDMDAFFASVEEVEKPYLRGLPLVIGADPKGGLGRGVVSTASYAARAYGIRSALPIQAAWKASEVARKAGKPPVVFITPRIGVYTALSKNIFKAIQPYASRMEVVSVDEAYLAYEGNYDEAVKVARNIKEMVKETFGLALSIGIGPNKMVAKLATELGKPDGLYTIRDEDVYDTMAPLPIRAMPGVGRKTEERLVRRGIRTIADLRTLSFSELEAICGSFGFTLYERVRGIASKEVEPMEERKSIGVMETFDTDLEKSKEAIPVVARMALELADSMRASGWVGFRKISVTVRFSTFETYTRQRALRTPRTSARDIEALALHLILPFFDVRENPRKHRVRLIGVRIEGRV